MQFINMVAKSTNYYRYTESAISELAKELAIPAPTKAQ